jgi:hypothetical protein
MQTTPANSTSLPHLASAALIAMFVMHSPPARAQHHGDDSHGQDFHGHDFHGHDFHGHDFHGHDFHGRDFGHFSPAERRVWYGGRWEHGWHDNRFAWWRVADGGWYFYPTPIYPYPTYVPPAIIVQQAPPMPTGLPPSQFWYYCDSPPGYYPYVAACNGPWREVPATQSR